MSSEYLGPGICLGHRAAPDVGLGCAFVENLMEDRFLLETVNVVGRLRCDLYIIQIAKRALLREQPAIVGGARHVLVGVSSVART